MAFYDLREFIALLEREGELIRIKAEVDPYLEITEITDRVSKQKGAANKALLFERPKGSSVPLLINAFGSYRRMSLALGVNDLDEVGQRLAKFLEFKVPGTLWEKMAYLPRLKEGLDSFPKTVKSGPCQEVVLVDNPSLKQFPILHCWPLDPAPFITLPLVFTKDPELGVTNVGMYRMQVYDERTTGMHWQIHKDGARHHRLQEGKVDRIPVSVAIGADPALIYAATAPLPPIIPEMLFAGWLRRKPVELVKCITNDLLVPATSEIVLEGYVDPKERRTEGPFSDHTGYLSLEDEYPVFHIEAITHRKNPIYATTIVGPPPQEDAFIGKATERIFLPLLRLIAPEILDMDLPVASFFHGNCLVRMKKSYPGQARKVMNNIWSIPQLLFCKYVVVFDEDVDIHNYEEAFWVFTNNVDPRRDIVIFDGPLDALDHSSPYFAYGAKMGIDATEKGPHEGVTRPWPPKIRMNDEVKDLVERRWQEYFGS